MGNGVLKALQIIGLMRDELEVLPPRNHDGKALMLQRRWGIDIADLVEWEKAGRSLAMRIDQQWQAYEEPEFTTLLSLIGRKADDTEMRSVRAIVHGTHRLPNGGPLWPPVQSPEVKKPCAGTPSTAAE